MEPKVGNGIAGKLREYPREELKKAPEPVCSDEEDEFESRDFQLRSKVCSQTADLSTADMRESDESKENDT